MFDSAREDWTSDSERLKQYFVGNDIVTTEKKRAILLSSRGMNKYHLETGVVGKTDQAHVQPACGIGTETPKSETIHYYAALQVYFLSAQARAVSGNIRC